MNKEIEYTEDTLTIPIKKIKDIDGSYVLTSEKKYFQSIVASGKTLEKAKENFWKMFEVMWNHHLKRSQELNKWKPFQKGDWSHIGGTWFTIFGIQVYIRYGKPMRGGVYIPLTKINISIRNYWSKKDSEA